MRALQICGLAGCFVAAQCAVAQRPMSPERAFREAVVHKQLYLRSHSAESEAHGVWDGAALHMNAPRYRALAAFETASVELHGAEVRLHGALRMVVRSADAKLMLSADTMPMVVSVEVRGDVATALPKLRDALFFAGMTEAVQSVPEELRAWLTTGTQEKKGEAQEACDCADTSARCVGRTRLNGSPGWKMPRPAAMVDTEGTLAGDKSVSARILLQIGEDGSTTDVWLLRPDGGQYQRSVAEAALREKYVAGTCHGEPKSVWTMKEATLNRF